ncbi:MAG: efflux RND transporter periplasmic adaptor subunit [Acidobacteria bacterium]|nr:MAG: efflux RND transporter periplasmic adaptor subunit [Acidobacteriota bacterium]
MTRNRLLSLGLLAALLPGLAALVVAGCGSKPAVEAKKAALHTCPMHPEIVRDGPGECPICGMDLVPVEEAKPDTGPAAAPAGYAPVALDARKRQLLGLRTARVTRAPLSTTIRTVGRVAADERLVHHVHTRFEAYVEHVFADFTGKAVRKGEPLAAVYSPELYASQQEYLLALRAVRDLPPGAAGEAAAGAERLLDAARTRLRLWEMSAAQVSELAAKGEPLRQVVLTAPISGIVVARTAYHGMKVMPQDTLFDIVDLSRVWVLADVYESELPRLRPGQRAEVTLSYWPGRRWDARVGYVYPEVDEKTRTVKVRLELANPRSDLKPGMFADVVLLGAPRDVLQVPDDAVLDSGTRKVVFVAEGDGVLAPREVTTGEHAGGAWEVRSGLSEGEEVALGAAFLVDSESRLKAALAAYGATGSRSGAPEATPAPAGDEAPAAPPAGEADPHAGHRQ